MSVLIKGMEMPKNCEECDFCHWSNLHQTGRCDRCDDEPVCADFGTDYKRTRARFCPLVEVPTPHGRLFDADELKKTLDERFDEIRNMYPSIRFGPGWMLASSVIMHSPTVIEAEREEHDE